MIILKSRRLYLILQIIWIKFFIYFPSISFAKDFDYGGVLASSFINNTGEKDSGSMLSGYVWTYFNAPFLEKQNIQTHIGFSFERGDVGQILLNQANFQYKIKDGYVSLGRSLNATGSLFRDLSDYGAPGITIDNSPNSFFAAGAFPSNVAQQIAPPFSNRVSYHQKLSDNFALGISYSPNISDYHAAGYVYYVPHDIKHEKSIALASEWTWKNNLLGITGGYIHGRYNDNINFLGGDVNAYQISMYLQNYKTSHRQSLYEFSAGCMEADHIKKDCRFGWQISHFIGKWVRSASFKRRINSGNSYNDYSAGISYYLGDKTLIGIEYIIREKENTRFFDSDKHWNFGISQGF